MFLIQVLIYDTLPLFSYIMLHYDIVVTALVHLVRHTAVKIALKLPSSDVFETSHCLICLALPGSGSRVDNNEIFEFTDADYETALPAAIAALKAGVEGHFHCCKRWSGSPADKV